MDQAIRNKLRGVVTQCRKLLEESVSQELQGKFGIYAEKKDAVQVDDDTRMTHLSQEERTSRKDILDHFEHIKARGFKPKEALDQLIREIAYTHLNRFCAYKMMEARQVYVGDHKFREAVSRGVNSNGVKFYLADHPDDERLYTTGKQDVAYRHFLDWLGGLLSEEIGVLFNPNDSANRLYPTQKVIDELLALLNDESLSEIWTQDETIGWVYQYFTPKELRDEARKKSQVPRNSYELAFRNQFFTPRYVVEFLTDNTLGRIWYEMRKGDTKLKDECSYLVRRPTEVFLAEGQPPLKEVFKGRDDLSQGEILKQPVHILHRPKKDPREIKIFDPASGSGHFLLYCFDLLLTIYEEAYDDPDLGPALKEDYSTLAALKKAIPGLILSRNLHGIDIDLRASQIAALALWLRCQRAYQDMGLKNDRPKITRSNIVCAEPMPGENGLLDEFLKTLQDNRLEGLIQRVMRVPEGSRVRATPAMADSLGKLVRLVWDKMQLAGEAGSLLKIEEELQDAIRKGQEEWDKKQPLFRITEFSLREEPKESHPHFVPGEEVSFWERAESLVMAALHDFATYAKNGRQLQRRLFAEDAVRGFAFVDLCRHRFDVLLMNPPFGEPTLAIKEYLDDRYPRTKNNLYGMFIERALDLSPRGVIGLISARTFIMYRDFERLRRELILGFGSIVSFADLGWGVLDGAQVETAAFVLERIAGEAAVSSSLLGPFIRLLDVAVEAKGESLLKACTGATSEDVYYVPRDQFLALPGAPLAYWASRRLVERFSKSPTFEPTLAYCGRGAAAHAFFFRLAWEIPLFSSTASRWRRLAHGGEYSPFFRENSLFIDWEENGRKVKEYILQQYPYLKGNYGWAIQDEDKYGLVGLTSGKRNERFNVQLMPAGHIFTNEGQGFIPHKEKDVWFSLGYLNSSLVSYFLALTSGLQKTWVYIRPVPVVEMDADCRRSVESAAKKSVDIKRKWSTGAEEAALFVRPWLFSNGVQETLQSNAARIIEAHNRDSSTLNRERSDLSEAILGAAKLDKHDSAEVKRDFERHPDDLAFPLWRDSTDSEIVQDVTARLVSYMVGICFGRWEIRYATGDMPVPELPEPFASLPVCPPGMLQNANGLPARPGDLPAVYPVRIAWDGILADDPEHSDDVVRRVQEVLELIWKNRTETIEKEACEILGDKELREYFRKLGKGGFWDDHVSRYSKNRRKAPIYWLLQSSKKNYALWLYYPRLDKDLLFKALVNYLEPKIQREINRLDEMRRQKRTAGETGKGAKKIDKDIERQEDLISELRDFEDKLRQAASLYLEPNLNDGVVLNIAPLHEIVPWKEANKYWEELTKGEYAWSSIGKQLRQKGLVK